MNKRILKLKFFVVAIMTISCSKDDCPQTPVVEQPTATEEIGYYKFLNVIIPNTRIQEFNWDPSQTSEIGYCFTPKVAGTMTSIEAKLPFVNGLTDVHVWDFDTRSLIRTETLNMALAGVIIKKNIAAIALQANKKYIITIETNVWYRYQKNDRPFISYPIAAGNLILNNVVMSVRDTYPVDINATSYFQGDIAFSFLKN